MARILIIDDDPGIRSLVSRALALDDHEVTQAADGAEGIQKYLMSPRDLVITDLLMDGMEGVETIRGLTKLAPGLPILAISGGGRADAEECLTMACHLGAARALRKPFTLAELRGTVTDLLDDARAKVATLPVDTLS